MPNTLIEGIPTHYEVVGDGPPLLMLSPGGFNARLDNWSGFGVYGRIKPVTHLAKRYTCIVFDRREAGESGGRVEKITWAHYVAQAKGLLDHLGIERAHVMGGCQGCSPAITFAVAHPDVVRSLVLYWPAGGPKYRIANHARFAAHLAYARAEGLAAIVNLVTGSEHQFGQDPRVGPWASVLRRSDSFAEAYVQLDIDKYCLLVGGMARGLFDRDTIGGAEPEDLLQLDTPAFIIPGNDDSHATSAARYLEECLPGATYWDVPVDEQTEPVVAPRLLEFLGAVGT